MHHRCECLYRRTALSSGTLCDSRLPLRSRPAHAGSPLLLCCPVSFDVNTPVWAWESTWIVGIRARPPGMPRSGPFLRVPPRSAGRAPASGGLRFQPAPFHLVESHQGPGLLFCDLFSPRRVGYFEDTAGAGKGQWTEGMAGTLSAGHSGECARLAPCILDLLL